MRSLRQSTAYPLMVFMTDSADHVSGKTGLTLAITASKNGAAFSSISPTVTEHGNGWYLLDLTTAHTDTLGDLAIHVTATGADPTDLVAQVRAAEALIATNLDATVSSRSAPGTAQTITSNADITAIKAKTDNLPASPAAVGSQMDLVNAPNATAITAIQSGLSKPGTAQTITSNADITAIKAKTDNLPASPAAVGSQMDLVNAPNATAITAIQSGLSKPGTAQTITSNADITAIKAKTDNLPASPAAVGSQMDLVNAPNATAITAIQSGLSKPGTAQTITSNADITAIKAKTDNLPSDPADQSAVEAAITSVIAALPAAIGSRLVAGFTWDEILHLAGALAASKLTGMTTGQAGTTKLRKLDDSGDLVSATQDANGNRTSVTVTP